ncbi:GNAT family N-acetyltransferase [Microbacterium sp. STN6]|uniref:GNAT family N-acetyltransferase n=1 Tax=Microbacterium sp. STN6 TaxID=2995588 RepID=UPI002260E7FE|nr:GNAT family N-acetyltransferase [Microbacterium sp. STN6]MCX7523362.1 GNAT family N-acetyltransferase [Microbacterium sp. STN6]
MQENWQLRPFQPHDLGQLVAGLALAAPTDAVGVDRFAENVLLDVNFQPGGLMVAVAGGRVVGALYAVVSRGAATPIPADGGWISFFYVHPEWQGRGIGSALLEAALAWLAERGATWANFSGYAPAYFLPGLDEQRYPRAMRVLTRAGFEVLYTASAMDLSIAAYRMPDEVRELISAREAEGYSFAPAGYGDLPEAIAFAAERLAPDWGQVMRESVLHQGHPERVLLARDAGGAVVGFATYGSYGGLIERFGPFGVDEGQRGRSLGKILLHRTMAQMRSEGAHSAWFLWTDEQSPAGWLYRQAGYTTTRTFHVMQRSLSTR